MRLVTVLLWALALALLTSGLALMLYYVPVAALAGTERPASGVWAVGPLTRGLHFWLAQAALLAASFAVCQEFFVKTNRPYTAWAAGAFLLIGLLWFTGMLLPWDQLNFWLAPMFRPPTGLLAVYWLHTLILSVLLLLLLIFYVRRLRSNHHETHS